MVEAVVVRPAAAEDIPAIARVHVDSWRTTYRGIVPDEYLAGLAYAGRERMWQAVLGEGRERHVALVAVDPEAGVCGFALGAKSDEPGFDGEILAIYLLASHQRRGIGTRLMWEIAGEFSARKLGSMIVWVLAENPARRFYEALGGRFFRSRPIEIGGETLNEVAYGWDHLNAFVPPGD